MEISKDTNLKINPQNKYQVNELKYAIDALTNHESSISWATEFENKFRNKIGSKFAIACNSGTSGLHAALFAAGVKSGDEVIIPGLTVIMDAFVVMHMGAIPIFADINIDDHLISCEEIKKKITSKTKAIITVGWDGISCDMDPIMDLANENGITVIDDCARAIMNTYKGNLSGNNAHISVFSFEAKKHITSGGEGGMIVTDDSFLAQQARKFAGIGYKHLTADAGRTHLAQEEVQNPDYKRFDVIGLNYRMNDISAAIGIGQLERIDEIISRRIKVGKMYEELFKEFKDFKPQKIPENCTHVYYTFSVDYQGEKISGIKWKDIYNKVKSLGGDGFYGVVAVPYLEPALKNRIMNGIKYQEGICPKAEELQKRVMCFKTNYRDLDQAKIKLGIISKALNSFGFK